MEKTMNKNKKNTRKLVEIISVATLLVSILVMSTGAVFAKSNTVDEPAKQVQKSMLDKSSYSLVKSKNVEVVFKPVESKSDKQLLASNTEKSSRQVVTRERAESVNPDYGYLKSLYQTAGGVFGIDWRLIEAVHQIESGKSGSTSTRSGAGATGPMQFLPSTFRSYAVDGNGDGVTDITNLEDAIFTGARYLANGGADVGNIDAALFNYNHSYSYVEAVKHIMSGIQG